MGDEVEGCKKLRATDGRVRISRGEEEVCINVGLYCCVQLDALNLQHLRSHTDDSRAGHSDANRFVVELGGVCEWFCACDHCVHLWLARGIALWDAVLHACCHPVCCPLRLWVLVLVPVIKHVHIMVRKFNRNRPGGQPLVKWISNRDSSIDAFFLLEAAGGLRT